MSVGRIITLLATALPLLCPYLPCRQCPVAHGESVAIAAVAVEQDHCCDACGSSADEPDPQPERCPDGCQLLNCFCGGAVVSSTVELSSPHHAINVWAISLEGGGAPIASQLARTGERPPDSGRHFSSLRSGREIRVLASSFLL